MRRVQENLSENWEENSGIFSLQNRENSIKLTDIIMTLISFKTSGLGVVLLSINRIKLNSEKVFLIDSKVFNLAAFVERVLKFEIIFFVQKIV